MSVNPIGEWLVAQNKVSLFREPHCFAFSTEGSSGRRYTFEPALYSIEYAIKLLSMFRHSIGENLVTRRPQDFPVTLGSVQRVNSPLYESCFLPKLCVDATGAPGVKVALFYDAIKCKRGDFSSIRWGIFDTKSLQEQLCDVRTPEVEAFSRFAPTSNKPSWEPVLKDVRDGNGRMQGGPLTQQVMDDKGQPLMQEADDHYAMTAYAKRFQVFVEYDSSGKVSAVFLRAVSLFDAGTIIGPDRCAITLADIGSSSLNPSSWGGHACIFIEGIEGGMPFMKMAQIRSSIDSQGSPCVSGPGLVECKPIKRFDPRRIQRQSATWSRDRDRTERMLRAIDCSPQLRDITLDVRGRDSVFITGRPGEIHNCYTWARSALEEAEIGLCHPFDGKTLASCSLALITFPMFERPNQMIESKSLCSKERVYVVLPRAVIRGLGARCTSAPLDITEILHKRVKGVWKSVYSHVPVFCMHESQFDLERIRQIEVTNFKTYQGMCAAVAAFRGTVAIPIQVGKGSVRYVDITEAVRDMLQPSKVPDINDSHPIRLSMAPVDWGCSAFKIAAAIAVSFFAGLKREGLRSVLSDPTRFEILPPDRVA
jgi:hypothetical protein